MYAYEEDILEKIKEIKEKYPDVNDILIRDVLNAALNNLSDELYKRNYLHIDDMTIGPDMLRKIGWLARNYSVLVRT